DLPTTDIYTLSLHDALPILTSTILFLTASSEILSKLFKKDLSKFKFLNEQFSLSLRSQLPHYFFFSDILSRFRMIHHLSQKQIRSEEHTSELQSRENLVCRL